MIANWLSRYFIVVVVADEMVLIAEGGLFFEALRCGMMILCAYSMTNSQQSRILKYSYIKVSKTVVYISYFITGNLSDSAMV